MDLSNLAPSVQRYFQAGLAPATHKTYHAAMKRFHNFCIKYSIANPFPVSEKILYSFATYLADDNLAPQTGKTYLSAVRNTQLSLGLPDPREASSMPILKRVQAGIKRIRMLKGASVRIRLPITIPILQQIKQKLVLTSHPEQVVIWAIACTAFFGFFRLGELLLTSEVEFNPAIHLCWGDIAVNDSANPSMVQIHLKTSKCDQFGRGSDIVVGRTNTEVCPLTAILAYVESRQDVPGPFFLLASNKPVTKPWFTQQIRSILSDIGLPQNQYAGHSFRIGAATAAALAGVPDSMIQTLGRWHSTAFLLYVRTPKEQLASLSTVLANSSAHAS